MSQDQRQEVSWTARRLGLEPLPDEWTGIDPDLPLIERMREEGAVIIIKFDGERTAPGDNGPYTFVAAGGSLGDQTIRIDTASIETGLAHIICGYFRDVSGL